MFISDTIQIKDSERVYSDEGFLTVPALIARTGIQNYTAAELGLTDREPNDIVRIYRSPEHVFDKKSLASFSHKPVTNDHPPELVNSKNSKNYSVGHADASVVRDGDYVKTTLHIRDQDSIDAIESGKVELSNGYVCELVLESGITEDGQTYDGLQTGIRGNHIALVTRGRAGHMCRVADHDNAKKVDNMKVITIDGIDFEVNAQAAQAVDKLQAELERSKKSIADAETLVKESKKEVDTMQAKLDDALTKVPSVEQLDSLVAERQAFVDSVKSIVKDFDTAGKTNEQIKSEIVAEKCQINLADKSVDYISARFDALLETSKSVQTEQLDSALVDTVSKEVDTRTLSEIARDKMIADARTAYQLGE